MQKDFLLEWPRLWIFKKHCIHNKGRYGNFLNTFKKDKVRYPLQFNKVKFDWKHTLYSYALFSPESVLLDFKCHLLKLKTLALKLFIWKIWFTSCHNNFYCIRSLFIKLQNLSHFNVCLHGSSYFFCLLYLFILPFFHAAFSWLTSK